ncbi:MAG: hypothetical protein NZ524_00140 [Thiobacillaceae bacterium]|nr:hypothetical protein [Thiobacillaceae bacterium]MCX7672400.1 hypothetical protein [Thiobacillaceae bacterium]MDW8323644.1 hypothetical protein [Burkholderiales bacterium]
MNVFVLTAGRSGSTTFIAACRHMRNFTCGHETRVHLTGPARLDYPPHHIEADNRLAWNLGRLHERYGAHAYYVHLTRERATCAASFARRADFGILRAWREGVLLGGAPGQTALDWAHDYLDSVEANIRLFLHDKPLRMDFRLERAREDFRAFWAWIGAEGDLAAALAEWDRRYNASPPG